MPRQRGAQPGNTNALKHGFYSSAYKRIDRNDIEALNVTIESEIAGLRVLTRDLWRRAEELTDPMDAIHTLALAGAQMNKIAGLLRTQAILTGGDGSGNAVINAAIEAVLKEKGLS